MGNGESGGGKAQGEWLTPPNGFLLLFLSELFFLFV
jgi:hypothetical protein